MAPDIEIIKQKNANLGQWLDSWRKRYERKYNFSNPTDQADFYEGMTEMARHLAHSSNGASLSTVLNQDGVTTVYVNSAPKLL